MFSQDDSAGQFCGLCCVQTEIRCLACGLCNTESGIVYTGFVRGMCSVCVVSELRDVEDVHEIFLLPAKDEVG